MTDPFTKSGSPVEGAVTDALQRIVSNNPAVRGLVNSMIMPSQGSVNTSPSAQVISDYRKASMHLPKYYKEPSHEKLATIKIINAISASDSSSDSQQQDNGIHAIARGADIRTANSFLLKRVQEVFNERHQIVETFGDDFGVFFTGETPKIFNFQGVLINDAYRMWKSAFILMYMSSIRGSELARQRLKVVVTYDYVAVEGYIFNLMCSLESSDDVDVPFSFDMLITKYNDLGLDEFAADPQFGGRLGQPLHTSSSSLLTSTVISGIIAAVPGLQSSPLLSPLMSTVDRVINQVMPRQSLAQLAGGTFLASNLLNVSNPSRIPNIINEAIAVVSATSVPVAPATSQLLGMFSDVVSGDFGDAVNSITKTANQFSGNNSVAAGMVSQFSNNLRNVSSVSVPGTLGLSQAAKDSLGSVTTMTQARDLIGQTVNGNLVNIPLALSLQDIINTLSTRN